MLLERLNEEGLNLAEIEVVENAPVKGPEWGNMHDQVRRCGRPLLRQSAQVQAGLVGLSTAVSVQIESMLAEDDPVRTYETRVPVTELPNFKRPRQPLSWGLVAACATTGAAVTGSLVMLPVALLCSVTIPCQ